MSLLTRLLFIVLILYQSLCTVGQEACRYIIDTKTCVIYQPVELYQTSLEETEKVLKLSSWSTESVSEGEFLEINHTPSQDFNIYLSIHNSSDSKVQMSFDLSLNYIGIMNLRSRVLLRKKKSD